MLRDAVVVVVRTRPREITLAMITMRKSIHGFPLFSHMDMGLRCATLRAAGAPLRSRESDFDMIATLAAIFEIKVKSVPTMILTV